MMFIELNPIHRNHARELAPRVKPAPQVKPIPQVAPNQRASTMAAYHDAIVRVIPTMRQRFAEALSLGEMAATVALSPCHFNRVFRKITGTTPARFLCALRLQAATHLLLTTQLSVTDVCFEVGYNSLGTFTTRFTQLIGLPPSQLRELAESRPPVAELLTDRENSPAPASPSDAGIHGQISLAATSADPPAALSAAPSITTIFVGLFPTAIPQGCPIACTVLTSPGPYHLRDVPDGRYYIFAAGFPRAEDSANWLMPDQTTMQVGMAADKVVIRNGRVDGSIDIGLRAMEVTDPPILSSLPHLLLTKYAGRRRGLRKKLSLN